MKQEPSQKGGPNYISGLVSGSSFNWSRGQLRNGKKAASAATEKLALGNQDEKKRGGGDERPEYKHRKL